ncbi:class I adenylate-forming enzyme family protein [Amycolatopsis keratiniphila]|uniref:class I adenylate-forming enzyme family protein n=1 Tax=Amycolatopsis keratiniphila TaxID=129921 RepID=UPI0008796E9D|nr:class I adenylate-forming enzyme family protein [Amycolatopsis keratiniphila]OLZ58469.1 AMP-dependent synthetase [Amycolatopsis keratiniphila subsp. nogabecina]SDU00958.1 Acyl-CoA synthetase (AMP-forming)/AMP-acid ligase II [Amycolatopsis keratiniphila]
MIWKSETGIVLRDLVPAGLRREWVRCGHCPDRDLYSLFRDRVREHPLRTAVIDDEGALDYTTVDVEVRAMAARLATAGCGSADIVGVREPDGRAAVVAELAILALGAVVLPLPRGADGLLERAGVRFVIESGRVSGSSKPSRVGDVDPDAPARILVSSGSESEPKMVAYSHNAFAGGRANYVRAVHGGTEIPRDLVLVSLTSGFGSFGVAVTLCRLGGTLILAGRFEAGAALRLITEHRPTHVFGVPAMWRRMVEHPAAVDTSGLAAIVSSGDTLPPSTRAACRRRFGVEMVDIYGSSDGVNCHTTMPENGVGVPDPAVCEVRLVDGEICARGPMTPLCYVGAPELDAAYRLDGGWVRTGDNGRFDDEGRLHVTGRRKRVVIRGGYTISPAEVELALGDHPAISEVACVPVPDGVLGERLCACVSVLGGRSLGLPELKAFLADRGVAAAKMPEFLIALPELPLGRTGKVCHRTLTEIAVRRSDPASPTARPRSTENWGR